MFQFARFAPDSLYIQLQVTDLPSVGFPHSDIPGSQVGYHLPEAYRRFLRPSSLIDVEASTVRPYVVQP